LIRAAREKEIDKLHTLTQESAKQELEEIINKPIHELDPNFWDQIREPYLQEFRKIASNCEELLNRSFQCNEAEIVAFMSGLETALHQHTIHYINTLFKDINKNLSRRFDRFFKKDEAGKAREWRNIEEG
jgi:hypothetical protein